MYVGIYEMDLFENFYTFKPSLETMQLSTYHREQNDIVELITDLKDLTRFTKIYLVKNHLNTNFPSDLICDPRVELIGLGFNNGKYPGYFFDEYSPDRYIYDNFLKILAKKRRLKEPERRAILDLQKCGFSRLYYNGKLNTNLPSENRIYLFDTNLDNSKEGLNLINSKNYRIIKLINNIYSNDLDTLINWAKNKWNFSKNKYILTRDINDKDFLEYLKKCNSLKVPIYFQIGNYPNGTLSKVNFKLWLHRTIYARSKGIKLRLYSVPNKLDFYSDLFTKLADWNNLGIKNKTFYKYFKDFLKIWHPTFELMLQKNKDIELLTKTDIDKIISKGGIYLYDR